VVAIRQYLEDLVARLRRDWSVPISYRVEYGDPATAIVAAAEEAHAAMVVMSTHGRTGLQRLALGSVTDDVLQHGRAPLVLMHPSRVASPPPAGVDSVFFAAPNKGAVSAPQL
jgi:nucleotide-binding universal stress UspA family protein